MTAPTGRLALCTILSAASILSACASWSPWQGGREAAAQRVAGLVDRAEPHWTIRACGQEHDRLLEPRDELKRLLDEVGQPGQVSIFAELAATEKDGRWM